MKASRFTALAVSLALAAGGLNGCTSSPKSEQTAVSPDPVAQRVPSNVDRNYPPGSYRDRIWNPDAFLTQAFPLVGLPVAILGKISLYQKRYIALLLTARFSPTPFFAELRKEEPIFMIPAENGLRDVVLLTRYENVLESFGTNGKTTTVPPNLKVPYDEHGMDETVKGPFMLGREGHPANAEKPMQWHLMNHVPSADGKSQVKSAARVREVVAQLTKEAIRDGIEGSELDIAKHISRNVPLTLVSEYFGFYGPSIDKMVEWSKATQHAFFHNPFLDVKFNEAAGRAVEQRSIVAGTEMNEWLTQTVFPELETQLQNRRPAYDTVSQMMQIPAHNWKGDRGARLATNVMGLLVGAGETSTIAIVQTLQYFQKNPEIYKAALAEAKKVAKNSDPAANDRFDRYVWEALRFDPLNPWATRYATADHTLRARFEGSDRSMEMPIARNTMVLVGMESGMHDSEYFRNPSEFWIDRDKDRGKYIHTSIGYHECLGAPVVHQMLPEIVKQVLLNLENAKAVAAAPDQKGGPFPESWVLKFDRSPLQGQRSPAREADQYVSSPQGLLSYLTEVGGNKVVKSDLEGLIATSFDPNVRGEEKKAALSNLADQITNAVEGTNSTQACMAGKFPSVETLDGSLKANFCKTPAAFRSCYLVQRSAGNKSAQHAFNTCAYGQQNLGPTEISEFKRTFQRSEPFAFLRYQWN